MPPKTPEKSAEKWPPGPPQFNQALLKGGLGGSDDANFADQLQTLIEEIKSDAKANTIFFKGMNIKRNVRLGNVDMESQGGNMSAVTDSDIGGDFTIGDVNMTNNG